MAGARLTTKLASLTASAPRLTIERPCFLLEVRLFSSWAEDGRGRDSGSVFEGLERRHPERDDGITIGKGCAQMS